MSDQVMWWKTPRTAGNDDVLYNAIQLSIAGGSQYRRAQLWNRYLLEWSYDRDRLIATYGLNDARSLGDGDVIANGTQWLEGQNSVPSPNIVRSTTDTVAQLLSKPPPIGVSAAGASFEDQFSIEEYENALDSLFNTPDCKDSLREVAIDATLSGIGYAMPQYERGKLVIRRLLPWQVMVDPFDARAGTPRVAHVIEDRDRGGILAWCDALEGITRKKAKMKAIRDMVRIPDRYTLGTHGEDGLAQWSVYDWEVFLNKGAHRSDKLRVMHSFRTASGPGNKHRGRHVVTVAGDGGDHVVLIDEPFERTTLPIVWFTPLPAREGIQGTGFGDLMLSWQEAVDRSMFKIQRALDKYGHIRIIVQKGSTSAGQKLNMAAEGITVIEVPDFGQVPRVFDPQVVRTEDVEHVARLMDMSQRVYGLNAMMSHGASQLGANASGQALQEEYYRTEDRFTSVLQRYQSFRLRLANEMLNVLDDILTSNKQFAASFYILGRTVSKSWKELTALRARTNITLEVRGEAAIGRGGRTARVQEWASQGLIDQTTAQEMLLATPDVRKAARINLAPIRLIEWQLRKVIESEDWDDAQPDKDTPLDIAITRSTAYIQRAYVEGAKPETIARLREYKALATVAMEAQQASQVAAMPQEQPPAPDAPA